MTIIGREASISANLVSLGCFSAERVCAPPGTLLQALKPKKSRRTFLPNITQNNVFFNSFAYITASAFSTDSQIHGYILHFGPPRNTRRLAACALFIQASVFSCLVAVLQISLKKVHTYSMCQSTYVCMYLEP